MSPLVSRPPPPILATTERQELRVAVAGESTRPTSFLARSFTQFRRTCFMTFPLAVLGSSSGTPSSPMNHTQAGAFCNRAPTPAQPPPAANSSSRTPTHLRIHPLRDEFTDVLARELPGVLLADDPRPDHLAQDRMRHCHRCGLANPGVCRQHVFDLDGEEVLSAAYDDVLRSQRHYTYQHRSW